MREEQRRPRHKVTRHCSFRKRDLQDKGDFASCESFSGCRRFVAADGRIKQKLDVSCDKSVGGDRLAKGGVVVVCVAVGKSIDKCRTSPV